jgi:ABC-2 type transport system ATP-binding protein
MTPAISVEDLSKSYGAKTVLNRINLELRPGEMYGMLGANGSGKSTLLRIIAGAIRPSGGKVTVNGVAGYVAQNFALYDDLFVEQNIAFSARCYGLRGAELRRSVEAALRRLDLTPLRRERAGHLSHGWKQRLALAAALCHRPSILLLDEATAGIDPVARQGLAAILEDCARSGMAVLITTHHLDEAERCHRIGYLHEGQLVVSSEPDGLKARFSELSGRHDVPLGEALARCVESNEAA